MKILMTGITGLVGASFVTAILRAHPDYRIVSLCRGFGSASGQERAEKTIRIQCAFDGMPETADEILSRVEIIEGTLQDLPCEQMLAKGPYDTFFHCAADVNLGKDATGKTYGTNFGGTQAALDLAKRAKIPTFHYVSTAYVAGLCSGRIMEDSMPATDFNNPYEKSKFESEKLVRESGFPYTIYRPSIVVGRRSDGVIRKPLAFYRILEFFAGLKHDYCTKNNVPLNGPFNASLRLEAGLTDKIYFVPVDYVQEAIVKLFPFPVENKTYHITGESPVATKWIEEAVSSVLQAKGLVVMEHVDQPTIEERLVKRAIAGLMPYFASDITFDSSNVREKLGDEILNWKIGKEFLVKMVRSYYQEHNPELL